MNASAPPDAPRAGRFLVLEGIDGCGKSTQLERLRQWLPRSGLMPSGAELVVTREPGGTPLGLALRELLLHPPGAVTPCATAELLLYAADRAQHVEQCIAPALAAGHWVLSDRFAGSTRAYQGHGRGLSLELIVQLEQIACAGIVPDLVLWLDLPPAEAQRRRGDRACDRIEAEGLAFLERVAAGFAAQAQQSPWCRVGADAAADQVALALQECIVAALEAG